MFRDDVGRNVVAGVVHLSSCFSPLMAEAIAVWRGLELADLSSFLVELDSLGLINTINSNLSPCSDLGLVLYNIYILASSLNVSSFSFVSRLANKVVDAIAKAALVVPSDLFWIESYSPIVELLVQKNALR
ncbi:hypothetical protein ACOSQ3_002519 [Xanthoceras sorbifolium]